MKLTDLREFILGNQRRFLVILVIFVLAATGMGWYYRRFINPSVPEEAKLPAFSLTSDTARIRGRIKFSSLSPIDVPEEIAINRVDTLDLSLTESEAVDLAARLGFTGEPQRLVLQNGREDFLFFNEEETLSISSQPRALDYIADSTGGGEGEVYDRLTAIEKAEEFLGSKGLSDAELTSLEVHYWDWGVNVYIEAVDPTDADFVEVSFVCLVEGQPLIGEVTVGASASVIFDRRGEVVSLGYVFLDNTFTQRSSVPLLSYEKAVDVLREEGLVIWTRTPGDVTGWADPPANLYSFTPESVRLVFCQPEGSDILYPVYFFEGSGRTTADKQVRAVVYLLAVSPEYIKPE